MFDWRTRISMLLAAVAFLLLLADMIVRIPVGAQVAMVVLLIVVATDYIRCAAQLKLANVRSAASQFADRAARRSA